MNSIPKLLIKKGRQIMSSLKCKNQLTIWDQSEQKQAEKQEKENTH